FQSVDGRVADVGPERISVGTAGNAEIKRRSSGYRCAGRSLGGAAVIVSLSGEGIDTVERLAGFVRVERQGERCELIQVERTGQVSALTADVRDDSHRVLSNLVLDIEVPLLDVRPNGFRGN